MTLEAAARSRKDSSLDVAETAAWLIEAFKTRFANAEGLISRNYPPDERTIFDNFDDIAPFLLYFGEAEFLLEQTHKLECDDFERILPLGNVLYAYKIDEYLGGLGALYRATGDRHTKTLLDDSVAKCLRYFLAGEENFAEFHDFRAGRPSPFFSPWSSGLLETFLELDEYYPQLPAMVERILDSWCDHPFFRREGLFPFRASFSSVREGTSQLAARLGLWCGEFPQFGERDRSAKVRGLRAALKRSGLVYDLRRVGYFWARSGHWAQLMKSNTTAVFVMIDLHQRSGKRIWAERVGRWIAATEEKMVRADGVHGCYRPRFGTGPATLVDGFILIDVLCDAWGRMERNPAYLNLAEQIALSCLTWRWRNGLIPMAPDAPRDHLDGQVDFAISLRRLGELTERPEFLTESRRLTQCALQMHRAEVGLCTHVDESGRQVRLPHNTVDPKYNGLALKGLVHLDTLGEKIHGNPTLTDLFKDR